MRSRLLWLLMLASCLLSCRDLVAPEGRATQRVATEREISLRIVDSGGQFAGLANVEIRDAGGSTWFWRGQLELTGVASLVCPIEVELVDVDVFAPSVAVFDDHSFRAVPLETSLELRYDTEASTGRLVLHPEFPIEYLHPLALRFGYEAFDPFVGGVVRKQLQATLTPSGAFSVFADERVYSISLYSPHNAQIGLDYSWPGEVQWTPGSEEEVELEVLPLVLDVTLAGEKPREKLVVTQLESLGGSGRAWLSARFRDSAFTVWGFPGANRLEIHSSFSDGAGIDMIGPNFGITLPHAAPLSLELGEHRLLVTVTSSDGTPLEGVFTEVADGLQRARDYTNAVGQSLYYLNDGRYLLTVSGFEPRILDVHENQTVDLIRNAKQ